MARIKYVYREGVGLVEVERDGKPVGGDEGHNNKGAYIVKDRMRPILHPCTGQLIDSKSKFRKITKANGCREVGGSFAEHKAAQKSHFEHVRREQNRKGKQELIRRFNG